MDISIENNVSLRRGAAAVIFLSPLIYFLGPLWDIDLGWHLAHGRYMLEHRVFVPMTEPFTFTSSEIYGLRHVILNGYWLSQVLMYMVYGALGGAGIVVARALLLEAALILPYAIGSGRASRAWLLALSALSAITLAGFTGERPQIASFILLSALYWVMEQGRHGCLDGRVRWRALAAMPALMMLWAAMHRGFMMGTVFIALYAGLIVLEAALFNRQTLKGKAFRVFLAFCLAAMLATLLNYNTYLPYVELLQKNVFQERTSEYMTPFELFAKGINRLPAYWLFMALAALAAVRAIRAKDLAGGVTLIVFGALSLTAFRYIPFFILMGTPIAAMHLPTMRSDRVGAVAVALLAIWIAVFSVSQYPQTLGRTIAEGAFGSGRFPVGAVRYIKEQRVPGPMFNHINWGGYISLMLYPDYKVFIDGRKLNFQAYRDYGFILWDEKVSPMLLDRYGIQSVVIPPWNPATGERYKLVEMLSKDRRWTLAYRDAGALVFVRR